MADFDLERFVLAQIRACFPGALRKRRGEEDEGTLGRLR
jgi:hypothetical protein